MRMAMHNIQASKGFPDVDPQRYLLNRKGSSSNPHFSGAMLNFERVMNLKIDPGKGEIQTLEIIFSDFGFIVRS